jgi:succinate-semialdehyde dehydrogenase / glutarate-semialdehyde dehydrogenase
VIDNRTNLNFAYFMPIQSYNPYTQEVLKDFVADDSTVINAKLDQAITTYQSWKKTPLETRIQLFANLIEVFKAEKENLAKLITLEVGVPIKQAVGQIDKCIAGINHYSLEMANILKPEVVDIPGQKSEVRLAPLGLIFSIMPWNFPFWQVMRVATPVILSGNVYAIKHASNVPQCSTALAECFLKAGFAEGVFTNFLVSGSDSEQIVTDSRVAGVSLTGSTAVGRSVAALCGQNVKPCVMELGGSDPFVVLNDADLSKVIPAAILSRFRNAGQSCNAAKRFIVQKEIAPEFTRLLVEAVEAMKILDPIDPTSDIGPVVSAAAIREISSQVNDSVAMGAKILVGGEIQEGRPLVYLPTVLTNITKDMPVYTEEVFGPVASIIEVDTVAEVIEVANDTEYGLGASLWTRDLILADDLINQLQAGNVFVNTMLTSDPKLPYGGIKNSGFGRELSHYGVKAFMNIKTVVIK